MQTISSRLNCWLSSTPNQTGLHFPPARREVLRLGIVGGIVSAASCYRSASTAQRSHTRSLHMRARDVGPAGFSLTPSVAVVPTVSTAALGIFVNDTYDDNRWRRTARRTNRRGPIGTARPVSPCADATTTTRSARALERPNLRAFRWPTAKAYAADEPTKTQARTACAATEH